MRFDAERIAAELAQANADHWLRQSGPYHEGGWAVAPLLSVGGRMWDPPGLTGSTSPTELLARCPYLTEVLDAFRCDKLRARASLIGPRVDIRPHVDADGTRDMVRLHVSVTETPTSYLVVNGSLVEMKPGESWFVDVSRWHAAGNIGPGDRIHLIVDCVVNDWIRGLLPPATLFVRNWRMRAEKLERMIKRKT